MWQADFATSVASEISFLPLYFHATGFYFKDCLQKDSTEICVCYCPCCKTQINKSVLNAHFITTKHLNNMKPAKSVTKTESFTFIKKQKANESEEVDGNSADVTPEDTLGGGGITLSAFIAKHNVPFDVLLEVCKRLFHVN